jgi:DNA transformation protein
MNIKDCINIGDKLAKQLNDIGVKTLEDLTQKGSVKTLIELGITGPTCSNKLYALEGAILGIRWHSLDKKHRDELYNDYTRTINEA